MLRDRATHFHNDGIGIFVGRVLYDHKLSVRHVYAQLN